MYPQKSGEIYLPWVRTSHLSDAARGVTWRTRDCHAGHVCLESLKPEWSYFFMAQSPGGVEMRYVTSVRDAEREASYKLRILCTSCEADLGPAEADNSGYQGFSYFKNLYKNPLKNVELVSSSGNSLYGVLCE